MKSSEIRALSVEELKQKEMDLRKELFNLRFKLATGELPSNMRVRAVRKEIAKILTVITEKEPHAGTGKGGAINA